MCRPGIDIFPSATPGQHALERAVWAHPHGANYRIFRCVMLLVNHTSFTSDHHLLIYKRLEDPLFRAFDAEVHVVPRAPMTTKGHITKYRGVTEGLTPPVLRRQTLRGRAFETTESSTQGHNSAPLVV